MPRDSCIVHSSTQKGIAKNHKTTHGLDVNTYFMIKDIFKHSAKDIPTCSIEIPYNTSNNHIYE